MTTIENEKKFKKYENKGLTGLANIGNTCYLNSCMQIFSHTYEFNDFLTDGDYKKKLNRVPDSVIILEWDKLRTLMWSSNCTVAPNGFVKAVQKVATVKKRDLFTGHAQNDIQEFLLFIIDCLHMSLARVVDMQITGNSKNDTDELAKTCYNMMKNMYKTEFSEMLSIFFAIHVSEISDLNTGETLSLTPEPFSVISLPIPAVAAPTIFDCFDLYCQKEILDGENKWFNSKTKENQVANTGIIFWSLPDILIIDLKRWNKQFKKVNLIVNAPINNADFSKYVKGYNSKSFIYDLYGICNHSGGALGGHYTAYVKNANEKWYQFNDTAVTEIAETNLISSQSYCFFYRKKK
jgi:ubiquitin carboxyl-terminal hydrolase 8